MYAHMGLWSIAPGQTHKYRRHMYTHTKHFAKQDKKGLMYQENIEMNLDMFLFKGGNVDKQEEEKSLVDKY